MENSFRKIQIYKLKENIFPYNNKTYKLTEIQNDFLTKGLEIEYVYSRIKTSNSENEYWKIFLDIII
mgnify:FL=1